MQRIVVPCRHHAPAARAPASHPSRPARDAVALHAQALRGKLGSVFDMLDARMPLAYMHIVHVLVDTLLYLAPVALYPKVGALAVPLSGILTLFYEGMLELSKSFLDPFGNEDSKAQNIRTDTLLAESNAGSTRWARMAERMPFSFPSGSPDPWSQAGAA